jgi:hypothetical protein
MPRFVDVPLSDIPEKQTRKKGATVLEDYMRKLRSMKAGGTATKFTVQDDADGYKQRNRIRRAAKAVGVTVKVKKVGKVMYFWREA